MKNLRKMFLFATLVLLLVGLTAVSAENSTDSDDTGLEIPTSTSSDVGNEPTDNVDDGTTVDDYNPEEELDGHHVSMLAYPVNAVAGEKFNFTAAVERIIPGLRLSEGQVEFTTDSTEPVTIFADVIDGVATAEYTAPEEWVGQTIPYTAKFTGTDSFYPKSASSEITVVREQFSTNTTMKQVLGEFDKPVTLEAYVITSTGDPVTGGQVYFMTTAVPIGEDGYVFKYVDVIDGVAKYETIAQRSWMAEGDVNTIEAVYVGTADFLESGSDPVPLRLFDKVYATTTTMDPVMGLSGQKINLTARVDLDEEDIAAPVEDGYVYFVVDEEQNITDENGNVLYADIFDGIASVETIANISWMNTMDSTIKAVYNGVGNYKDSESTPVFLRVYDYFINTTTTMEPVKGVFGELIRLTAHVTAEDGSPVNTGDVSFLINGKTYIDDGDHGQEKLIITPVNGLVTYDVIADKSWDNDLDTFIIKAIYEGDGPYLDSNSSYVAMDIVDKETPSPSPKVIPQKQKSSIQATKTVNTDKTFKVLVKDNVVYTGNVITLETINNIFNKEFTNGILVVYLDGEVVFNSTTTDDLSLVIIQIIESLIGQHELKVEFTDSNNETNTYVENITIN